MLHAVVIVPPPRTGMTIATQRFLAELTGRVRIKTYPIQRKAKQGRRTWAIYKHLKLLWNLMRAAGSSRGRDDCYFVLSAGSGLAVNAIAHIPIMALCFRRVIFHHHVFSYVQRQNFFLQLILLILGDRAVHITLGPEMSRSLLHNYRNVGTILELNNAGISDITEAPPTSRDKCRTIGFLSNISFAKGIATFIEISEMLQKQIPEISAVIAGPQSDPKVSSALSQFVLLQPDTRTYLGEVRDERKRLFFEKIDVLVFPSQYKNEALPLTILEALAAGVPTIATELGCIPSMLSETAWVSTVPNIRDFAVDLICTWAVDSLEYQRQQKLARTIFEGQLSLFGQQTAAIVAELNSNSVRRKLQK